MASWTAIRDGREAGGGADLVLGSTFAGRSMMRKEGNVAFNGAPPNKNMKRSMGFVMQVPILRNCAAAVALF